MRAGALALQQRDESEAEDVAAVVSREIASIPFRRFER